MKRYYVPVVVMVEADDRAQALSLVDNALQEAVFVDHYGEVHDEPVDIEVWPALGDAP